MLVRNHCSHGAQVTQRLGLPPIKLAFERVMHPYLLVHVNRYAGVEYNAGEAECWMVLGLRETACPT